MKLRIETWTGKVISLNVDAEESIETIMRMAAMQCQLPSDQQMLLFEGKQIPDGTLLEFGIDETKTLKLVRVVRRPLQGNIFVQSLSGKLLEFRVSGNTMVRDLKKMINIAEKIDAKRQRLIFAGQDLEDSLKLADYGMQNEDTIQLRLPVAEGGTLKLQVRLPSGRTMTVPASTCKTVQDIMLTVEHYENIAISRQHVYYGDEELPLSKSIDDLPSKDNVIPVRLKVTGPDPCGIL